MNTIYDASLKEIDHIERDRCHLLEMIDEEIKNNGYNNSFQIIGKVLNLTFQLFAYAKSSGDGIRADKEREYIDEYIDRSLEYSVILAKQHGGFF